MRNTRKNKSKKIRQKSPALSYTTISKGFVVGIAAGIVVTLYRLCLAFTTKYTFPLYEKLSDNFFSIIGVFAVLALCGYIVGLFIKLEPMITGSGIPQVSGILIGKMRFRWFRVVLLKFIGGIISLGVGLSLGREGPSVQLGAATGLGVAKIADGNISKQKLLLSYGSAAGLAAAFNAPLAGICFVIEELLKSISKYSLIGAATAALTADFISKQVFGTAPVFNIANKPILPLNQYFYLIILGGILGVAGVIFNKVLLKSVIHYDKLFKLPIEFKPIIPFLSAGIVGFLFPMLLGGGHELVEKILINDFSICFLVCILIVKFIFTMVSYSSSAPGGIFLPLLSIGALIGCITAKIFVKYLNFDSQYISTFIILAMAGYFTAVVKSPLTGIILLSEMSGCFENFLMISIVCIIAYIVSDLLKGEPVYEILLKNSLKKSISLEESTNETLIDITIKIGTHTVGLPLKSLVLPDYIKIIAINRYGTQIKITDNLKIAVGDVLAITTSENMIDEVLNYFEKPKRNI